MKITAYADRLSAAPGETVRFFVSCDGVARYRADIVRLICGDLNPKGPGYKERVVKTPVNKTYKGRKQVIAVGSYGVIPAHRALDGRGSYAVQVLIWPTTPDKGEQVLLAKWHNGRGFELIIDEDGRVAVRFGDGRRGNGTVLPPEPHRTGHPPGGLHRSGRELLGVGFRRQPDRLAAASSAAVRVRQALDDLVCRQTGPDFSASR